MEEKMNYNIMNREGIRVDVKLPVMFITNDDMDVANTIYSETVNISMDGACLYSIRSINPSSEITIGLFLPKGLNNSDEVIFVSCRAVVIYSSIAARYPDRFCYFIGIRFTDIENSYRDMLNKFIEERLGRGKDDVGYVEKRRGIRVDTSLQAVLLDSDLDIEGVEYTEIRNISYNGVYLLSRRAFAPSTIIQIGIFIPIKGDHFDDEDDKLIRCKARVVRLEDTRAGDSETLEFGIGIEFVEMTQEDSYKLREFISFAGKNFS